jgi:hypothetical protein
MKQIVEGTAATFGATAELNYKRNYPVTVNSEENTEFAAEAARKVSGDCDTNAPLVMGGEDFAFMLEERPGAYILVGNGRGRAGPPPEIRLQRRGHPGGLFVVGGDRGAAVAGGLSGLAAAPVSETCGPPRFTIRPRTPCSAASTISNAAGAPITTWRPSTTRHGGGRASTTRGSTMRSCAAFWTNEAEIAPGVWRSNHPTQARLQRLKARGSGPC